MLEQETVTIAPVRVDVAGAEELLLRDVSAMLQGLRRGRTQSPTQTMLDRAKIAVYHEAPVVTYALLGDEEEPEAP